MNDDLRAAAQAATPRRIPEYRLATMSTTAQGMGLYERAEADYPEPFRSEVMATVHLIEKQARAALEGKPTSG